MKACRRELTLFLQIEMSSRLQSPLEKVEIGAHHLSWPLCLEGQQKDSDHHKVQ